MFSFLSLFFCRDFDVRSYGVCLALSARLKFPEIFLMQHSLSYTQLAATLDLVLSFSLFLSRLDRVLICAQMI